MYYYDGSYIFVVLICLLLSFISQTAITSAYNKYAKIETYRRITGAEAARMYLDRNGLSDVQVTFSNGETLSDFYNPTTKTICLSPDVYNNPSISSVAVACHEVGHAIQHKENYRALVMRNKLLPTANVANRFSWIIMVIGLLLNSLGIVYIGLALFAIIVLFHLVTLPVEINASKRALEFVSGNLLNGDECVGAKKVLRAAAFTYVAALLTSLTHLLYYLGRFSRRRK